MRARIAGGLWIAGAPARLVLLTVIRLYHVALGGLLGGRCRFYPSCSSYAEQAIRQCGAVRGLALAGWRILRCSPLSGGGVDRPPEGRGSRSPLYEAIIQQGVPGPVRPTREGAPA